MIVTSKSTTFQSFADKPLDLSGKSILVTGGTGSFGKAFIDSVLKTHKPRRLIVFSRDEFKQSQMASRYSQKNANCLRFFIGDVRDKTRLEMAMLDIDIVIHAAALKHVPIAEYNPIECINTNVVGAENVIQAAIRNKVSKVMALSTDKAVNPINLYGASKLASDKLFIAANNLSGSAGTQFSIVRYGNVIGSRGSVVPLFQKLKSEKKKLPITNSEMTRFWITLRQGVNFVLSSIGLMQGGEVFVPKLPSMRITEVACALAPDSEHVLVGIRPGEKLHEALITREDALNTLALDDRYIILPNFSMWRRDDFEYLGLDLKNVPEDFEYSSESNEEWLSRQSFLDLVNEK